MAIRKQDMMASLARVEREQEQNLENATPEQIQKRAAREIQTLESQITRAKETIKQCENALPFWRKVAQA